MNTQYHAKDVEPASYLSRKRWVAPMVVTLVLAGLMALVRAAVPAAASFLPDALYLSLFCAGSFLTWRAAFWAATRSSRIMRWVAPALPLALMAAAAFLSPPPLIV